MSFACLIASARAHTPNLLVLGFIARACGLLFVLVLTACSSVDMLARHIAEPEPEPVTRGLLRRSASVYQTIQAPEQRLALPGGPTLSYRILRPAYYRFRWRQHVNSNGERFDATFQAPGAAVPGRGTIMLLHGWSLNSSSLLPWALGFAERGYRVVLVDLRSHGRSSKASVGYGQREGADVAALVRILRMRGEIDAPLALFGVSYGAVSAVYASAELGPMVRAVVAMEPFANAGDGIRDLIHGWLQEKSGALRGRLLHWYLLQRVDQASIAAAVPRAGRLLHLNLDALDTRTAMAHVPACVLLLHGAADTWLPSSHSRQLLAVNSRAQLRVLPGESHLSLPLRIDWLLEPIASWLATLPTRDQCARFLLPSAPQADSHGETHLQPPEYTALPGPWQPRP